MIILFAVKWGIVELRAVDGEAFGYAGEAIRQALEALDNRVPLIGFAGAPFTLASYAIEGGQLPGLCSNQKPHVFLSQQSWHQLMSKTLSCGCGVSAGSKSSGSPSDSNCLIVWVGCLSPGDYEEYVLPHVQSIFSALRVEGIPLIYFGTGTTGPAAINA